MRNDAVNIDGSKKKCWFENQQNLLGVEIIQDVLLNNPQIQVIWTSI